MLEFYNLGKFFIDSLSEIGEFLLHKPFNWLAEALRIGELIGGYNLPDAVWDYVNSFSSWSIATIIFGAGLATILSYKIVKFILDIFF